MARHAPVFRVAGLERAHNRIGALELVDDGSGLDARVDSGRAVLYAERLDAQIGDRRVHQLVYRVHFERIPLRPSPYFFEAHRNPGLLFLVSVDAATGEVLAFTTVHTCGCYLAVVPTEAFPDDWLPAAWPRGRQRIHGQTLPARLPAVAAGQRFAITIEPESHRVVDVSLELPRASDESGRIPLALLPLEALRVLPVAGQPDRTASVFYSRGPLRGHLRGSWNFWEGVTLGWIALDPTVGMDKDFGPPEETGTPFYTMLRFWKQDESRLDRFDTLLRELGFRLP